LSYCTSFLLYDCPGQPPPLHSFPTRRSSDLLRESPTRASPPGRSSLRCGEPARLGAGSLQKRRGSGVEQLGGDLRLPAPRRAGSDRKSTRLNSQSRFDLVCRLLLEKKKNQ